MYSKLYTVVHTVHLHIVLHMMCTVLYIALYVMKYMVLCISLSPSRVKLQGFLESSVYYAPACLLSEVVDTDMYRECSVLYGRVCCQYIFNF